MNKRGFYRKMLWMFTVISIIPTIVIGLVTTFSMKKAIEERLIAEVQNANVQCMESIEEILGIYEECMDRIQKELPLEEYFENFGTFSKEKFYERIHSIVSTSMLENPLIKENLETTNYVKDITNVHFINHETGEILSLYETPAIYEYPKNANWGIYRNAQSHKAGTIYFHSYKDGVGKEMLGTAIKAIYEEEKLLGYIALDIPLEVIKEQTVINSASLPLHFSLISDQNYVLWDDNELEHTASFLESKYFMEEGTYTVNDKEIFISKAKSDSYPIQLFGGFNLELILGNLNTIWYIWITAIIVLILLCVITTWKVTKIVINPLKILTSNMKLVESGNFDVSIDMENDDEFGYVARRFNDMCEKIKELFRTNEEKQKQLRIAEVKKLQSQINPHFLYNTLDSIKYLAKMNGEEEIFIMTKSLNSLLKNGFNLSKEFATLKESLANLSAYIAIQKIRFSDKFEVIIDVKEEHLDIIIPNLILQPVIENAILHGLEPHGGHGELRITSDIDCDTLRIAVSDTGVGMTQEQCCELVESLKGPITEEHIGLKNVHQRLQLYYGTEYGLSIESQEDKGTIVVLRMPYEEEKIYGTVFSG